MEIPKSLPSRVYLLAHDPVKQKLTSGDRIGLALRAAALTDLYLRGHLADDNGHPKAIGAPVTGDPLLADLFQQIAHSKPMAWHRWIGKDETRFRRQVRDHLVHHKLIRVEPRRIFGIFPSERIIMRENRLVAQLRQTVAHTLRDGASPTSSDRRDAAMTALAAASHLRHVIDRQRARERKHRIDQLSEAAGPAMAALHKAIQHKQSSYSAG